MLVMLGANPNMNDVYTLAFVKLFSFTNSTLIWSRPVPHWRIYKVILLETSTLKEAMRAIKFDWCRTLTQLPNSGNDWKSRVLVQRPGKVPVDDRDSRANDQNRPAMKVIWRVGRN